MHITQSDIAQLDDPTVKRLALMYDEMHREGGPLAGFARSACVALVHAMRERRSLVLYAEADLMNDDGEGALVEPGDDPVGDALRELRGESP